MQALFDNYALDEQDLEVETQKERDEVHDLLQAVGDSAPMLVARKFVEEATGAPISVNPVGGTRGRSGLSWPMVVSAMRS